ncbi:unnamed protein product [Rhodiola kirilowii]
MILVTTSPSFTVRLSVKRRQPSRRPRVTDFDLSVKAAVARGRRLWLEMSCLTERRTYRRRREPRRGLFVLNEIRFASSQEFWICVEGND